MFAGIFFLLGQLVAEFANLNDAADRRHGVGGDFHEIHPMLAREVQRVVQRKHAKLLAVGSNDPDFAGTDFPIHTHVGGGGGITVGLIRATQATLTGWD